MLLKHPRHLGLIMTLLSYFSIAPLFLVLSPCKSASLPLKSPSYAADSASVAVSFACCRGNDLGRDGGTAVAGALERLTALKALCLG